MASIAVAFGSNLGDRAAHIDFALARMAEDGIVWSAISSLYLTIPVGMSADSPTFLNGAAIGATNRSPHSLLQVMQTIEAERGRLRTTKWDSRTLDIDLLLYDDLTIDTADLIVPHPRLAERAFVLVPLAEIAANRQVPGIKRTVGELLAQVAGKNEVKLWRYSATKPPI